MGCRVRSRRKKEHSKPPSVPGSSGFLAENFQSSIDPRIRYSSNPTFNPSKITRILLTFESLLPSHHIVSQSVEDYESHSKSVGDYESHQELAWISLSVYERMHHVPFALDFNLYLAPEFFGRVE